jgi:hypothetical protein
MAHLFDPRAGDVAPAQQSGTTCGSACLTVTRMLADDAYAAQVLRGDATGPPTPAERFAAAERQMARATNAPWSPSGRLQLPWPRSLGTPPWGARAALESLTGVGRGGYAVLWVRWLGPGPRSAAYDDLRTRVTRERPALLYVGSPWLPRHVVLVLPGTGRAPLMAYEPAEGRFRELEEDAFAGARLGLGGWHVPWALVAVTRRPQT